MFIKQKLQHFLANIIFLLYYQVTHKLF